LKFHIDTEFPLLSFVAIYVIPSPSKRGLSLPVKIAGNHLRMPLLATLDMIQKSSLRISFVLSGANTNRFALIMDMKERNSAVPGKRSDAVNAIWWFISPDGT
jgi:hypothetical protein